MKLSYIELINGFWTYYDANKSKISPSDITLYMVLLRYCNKINWINPFTINPFLMAEINPLSQNTYYKSLKNLNDCGIIKWEKGKHNVSNLKITILKIKVSVNNSIDNSIKFSVEDSIDNSIVNNNKTTNTIKQLNNKPEIFANFDFSFFTEIKSDIFDFIEFRKTIKKPIATELELKAFLNKLSKYSKNNLADAKEIMQNSIANRWQGIFELKEQAQQQSNQPGAGATLNGIFIPFDKMTARERAQHEQQMIKENIATRIKNNNYGT